MVLYMSFDKFLLAVESCDLSQADKSIKMVPSFSKLFLNDKIDSYRISANSFRRNYSFLKLKYVDIFI